MPRKAEKQVLHNHVWEKKVPGIQFDINKFLEVSHSEATVLPVKVGEVVLAGTDCALSVQHKNWEISGPCAMIMCLVILIYNAGKQFLVKN
jgi:hypothetical protein